MEVGSDVEIPRVNGGNRQGLVPGALRWNYKHYLSLVTFA